MEARQCAVLTIGNRLPQQILKSFSDTLVQPIEICPQNWVDFSGLLDIGIVAFYRI
jgi:hypothetical protein